MTDSLPALHRAEGHGKLGELVHRLVERAGPRGALTEAELRAELPSGLDAHLQAEVTARLAVQGVSIVPGPGVNGDHGSLPVSSAAPTPTPGLAGPASLDDGRPVGAVVGLYEVDEVSVVARRQLERPAGGDTRGSGTSDPV